MSTQAYLESRRSLAVRQRKSFLDLAFASVIWLGVFQCYAIAVGAVYLSLYLIAACSLIVLALPHALSSGALTRLITALLIIELVSMAWSPDPMLAIRDVVYALPFLAIYISGVTLYHRNQSWFIFALKCYSLLIIVNSLAVILFRLDPGLESGFLSGKLAALLINPNALAEFNYDLNNNVKDFEKAGGFFLNGNTGAVLSEGGMCLAVALSQQSRASVVWWAVALVHLGAALASGSKSALALVTLAPFIAHVAIELTRPGLTLYRVSRLSILILLGAASLWYVSALLSQSDLAADAQINAYRRTIIWRFAEGEFWRSPVLGLGYGGWKEAFAATGFAWRDIGLTEEMPPHNNLVILWANSGLFAAAFGAAIIVMLARNAVRIAAHAGDRLIATAASTYMICFIVHGLGDNFSLLAEPRIQGVTAIFAAWSYSLTSTRRDHAR